MLSNRYVKWGGIIVLLILANIINSIYWNWGLITVKVTDVPLSKVIKSIEWQGWVKIYTNLPPDTQVTMFVDHVPLAEAMETLAANANPAPPTDAGDRHDQPPRDGAGAGNNPPPAGGPPGTNATAGANPGPGQGAPGGDRPPGGRGGRGGGGRGGFGGGGTTWNLAFFVAPTSAGVKDEIRAFESGTTGDDTKIYSFPTPMQMISDMDTPAADPRLQTWPGVKPPAPPAPAPPPPADGQTAQTPDAPAAAPVDTTPTAQTYLRGFAEAANIWIMVPDSWTPAVSGEPPANSSIISAVKKFVGRYNGSVVSAIILRSGRGGGGRGQRGGGGGDADMMADRVRNAINGLPEEARPAALEQLDQEVKFQHDVKLAPPDQQRQMMMAHMREKMGNNNNWRRSPEGRAKMYSRVVSNRETAQGKK